jgi:hypothetical protein
MSTADAGPGPAAEPRLARRVSPRRGPRFETFRQLLKCCRVARGVEDRAARVRGPGERDERRAGGVRVAERFGLSTPAGARCAASAGTTSSTRLPVMGTANARAKESAVPVSGPSGKRRTAT